MQVVLSLKELPLWRFVSQERNGYKMMIRKWLVGITVLLLLIVSFVLPQSVIEAKYTPVSSSKLVGKWNEFSDTVKNITLLQPESWPKYDLGNEVGFILPNTEGKDDRIVITATNLNVLPDEDNCVIVQKQMYQNGQKVSEWVNAFSTFADRMNGPHIIPIDMEEDMIIAKVQEPNPDLTEFVIYKIADEQLLTLTLQACGKYDEVYLRDSGILTDFIAIGKYMRPLSKHGTINIDNNINSKSNEFSISSARYSYYGPRWLDSEKRLSKIYIRNYNDPSLHEVMTVYNEYYYKYSSIRQDFLYSTGLTDSPNLSWSYIYHPIGKSTDPSTGYATDTWTANYGNSKMGPQTLNYTTCGNGGLLYIINDFYPLR